MAETLTVEEAREQAYLLKRRKGAQAFAIRTCWNCNAAHEHLRDPDWTEQMLVCIGCNRVFYRGLDITEDDVPDD